MKDKRSHRGAAGEDGTISKGHTPEKSAFLKRKREEKAARKNMVWVTMQDNPSNAALKKISGADVIFEAEEVSEMATNAVLDD